MLSKITSKFTIEDFQTTINGALKSSKEEPLIISGIIKLWHSGGATKLIKVENNRILFVSTFRVLKSKIGSKKVEVAISANLDNENNYVEFTYQAYNIKKFPNWLEKLLKTNKIREISIPLPEKLLFLKEENSFFELDIQMEGDNSLSVDIVLPLDADKFSDLR